MASRDDARAQPADEERFRALLEPHRRALKAHCYRMTGTLGEAEELAQETLLKAWRALDSLESQSALRPWLYRIATRACLDAVELRARRPEEPLAGKEDSESAIELTVEPCPDSLWEATEPGPDARVTARESVALAFVSALRHLPPAQRAVLLLRDVLGWSAAETAELLERTPAAVESALERARASTEARRAREASRESAPDEPARRELLRRYLAAWESSDPRALTSLLREDALLAMPPSPLVVHGRDAIQAFLAPILAGLGERHAEPVGVSGELGLALWVRAPGAARFHALGIQLVRAGPGGIAELHSYLSPALHPHFGLPLER